MEKISKFIGFKPLYSYGKDINSYDMAKFLAIFFMIIDHFGFFFFKDDYFLRGLGRLAFPIFFFLIGYSNNFKLSWNLLILGTIITVYRGVVSGVWHPFDILISAFLTRVVLDLLVKKDFLKGINLFVIFLAVLFWHLGVILFLSYGALGIIFAVCGYLKRKENDGAPQKYLYTMIFLAVISDYFMQRLFWEETENFKYIFSAVSIFLLYYFMNFRMDKVIEIKNNLIRNFVLFLSRNSLLVYWVHFLLFVTLSVLLFPERYVN